MKINGRKDILDAALDILAFEGLDRLSTESLARRLGINKSSLYHWFRSKDEIIDALFTEGHRALMSKGFRLTLDGSPEEVLTRAASEWQSIFTDDAVLPYLRAIYSLKFSDPRAEEEARAIRLMIESQIDVLISSLGYQDQFLSSLFSSLLLQKLESELEGKHEDIEEYAKRFATMLATTDGLQHP